MNYEDEETTHDKSISKRRHETEIEENMQIQRQSEELEECRKNNCIQLQLATSQNTNSEDEKVLLLTILDIGNNLKYPAISNTLYKTLKQSNVIPQQLRLKRTNINVGAANGSTINIKGRLNFPLIFKTESGATITFANSYVIDGLLNDINIGKAKLGALDTKWFFKTQEVLILDSKVKLYPPKSKIHEQYLQTIQTEDEATKNLSEHLNPETLVRLYSTHKVIVPPQNQSCLYR